MKSFLTVPTVHMRSADVALEGISPDLATEMREVQERVLRLDVQRAEGDAEQKYTCIAYDNSEPDSYWTKFKDLKWARSVKAAEVPLLLHHDAYSDPVGKLTRVWADGDKLMAEFVFAETERAQELRALVDGGFITGVSIRFMATEYEYDEKTDLIQFIGDIRLLELSLVNIPASRGARIQLARSMGIGAAELGELHARLAAAGLVEADTTSPLELAPDPVAEAQEVAADAAAQRSEESAEPTDQVTPDFDEDAAVAGLRARGFTVTPADPPASDAAATVPADDDIGELLRFLDAVG